MSTISIWDLFFLKNALYGFHYFKYATTLAYKKSFIFYIYRTILLETKFFLITLPLKFLSFLRKNAVLSFKENYITTLIVEGGWASDDNNSSFSERPHARFFAMKTVLKIILLLHKNYLLFCGMFEKYPIFI